MTAKIENKGVFTMKLSKIEKEIANFLENNHDIDNPISSKDLASYFEIEERELRDHILNIILAQRLVIGSDKKGYWVASDYTQIKDANKTMIERTKSSLERIVANRGNVNWMHNFLKELNLKYPKYHDDQIEMEFEDLGDVNGIR